MATTGMHHKYRHLRNRRPTDQMTLWPTVALENMTLTCSEISSFRIYVKYIAFIYKACIQFNLTLTIITVTTRVRLSLLWLWRFRCANYVSSLILIHRLLIYYVYRLV